MTLLPHLYPPDGATGMPWGRHLRPVIVAARSSQKKDQICRLLTCTSRLSQPLQTQTQPKPHYTTTPIFYVNAEPHLGHLHSIVLADVFSRWAQWRNRGWSTQEESESGLPATQAVLTTGTDEHGIKIQQVAERLNEQPRELCNRVSQRFRVLADRAGARYTRFIRTTDEDHVKAVVNIWSELEKRGYIYKGKHEGWYAVSDEAFYTSQQIRPQKGGGDESAVMVSVETGSVVEWSSEDNYKFKLSAFQQPLLDWLKRSPDAVLPASRREELIAEIEKCISDLSVSRPRSRLHWGIACPSDGDHTIYVWLDALTNYLTAAGYPWNGSAPSQEKKKQLGCWPTDVQVIGKDILRFHTIYFPAFLMALDLPLPKHTVAHGHWTVEGHKMSKSRGNVIDPFKMIDEIGRDELRWFLCRMGGNTAADADWSDVMLHEYHRKYIQSQWGSFISRIMAPTIVERLITDPSISTMTLDRPSSAGEDDWLAVQIETLAETVQRHMDNFDVKRALESISDVLAAATKHFSELEPWVKTTKADDVARAFFYSTEAVRIAALLARPVLPDRMQAVLDTLHDHVAGGQEWSDALRMRDSIVVTRRKGKMAPLFPKLMRSANN